MKKANSKLVKSLQYKYANQNIRTSAISFEVRVQEQHKPGRWRTVSREKMTLKDIQEFKGKDGDFMIEDNNLIISDDYVEPTQKLKININLFIGGLISK